MGDLRLPLLVAVATAPADCGPSPQQIGEQVLLVAPLVFGLAVAAQWLLLRLWRRRGPALQPHWPAIFTLGAALLVPAGLVLAFGDRRREWLVAVWLFGCSYATVLLVATRLTLWLDRER